jgi:TDG/mug DNA glycosylase family protein
MDKVPFYSALKKFRDYLNGLIPEIDENEVIFNDPKIRAADDGTEISEHLKGNTSNHFICYFYSFNNV